jgi:hypothetical protein
LLKEKYGTIENYPLYKELQQIAPDPEEDLISVDAQGASQDKHFGTEEVKDSTALNME